MLLPFLTRCINGPAPRVWRALGGLFWLLGALPLRAQTPAWQSAIAVTELATGSNSATVTATAADGSGNLYVAGTFYGTVSLGAFTLTSTRGGGVFVAKWNPASGSFVWAESAATYATSVDGLAVSGSSVYVCGTFYGPASFGSTSLTSFTPNSSLADVFVAKLTDAGATAQFVWAQQAGGLDSDYVNGLAASGGSVYLTGAFQSPTAAFGTTTIAKAGPSNFTPDAYVAKLTDAGSTGRFAWAQRLGGTGQDYGRAIAVNGPNFYLAGGFTSPTFSLGSLSLSNAGTRSQVYVARFTDAGTGPAFAWAQLVGDGGGEYASALAVSGSSLYLAGGFSASSIRIGTATLSNSGPVASSDLFLAKLTDTGSSGAIAWAQGLGGSANDELTALAVSGSRVYAVGNFNSLDIHLGPLFLNNAGGGTGYPDLFATRITDLGTGPRFDWAQRAGGPYADHALPAALVGTTLYVAGTVYTPAFFDAFSFVYPPLSYVPFVAGLDDSAVLTAASASPLPGFSLAPSPAHATTTVRLPAVPGATQATLRLLDALGRPVRTRQLPLSGSGLVAEFSLLGLAPGLYHLQVQAGGQHASRALTVE